jgi:iron complex transport system permease protein
VERSVTIDASIERGPAPALVEVADRSLADVYRSATFRKAAIVALSFAALMVLAGSVAIMGIAKTSLADLFAVLAERLSFGLYQSGIDERTAQIIIHLRLPRVVMAMVGGGSLALAGVLMQAITRNPLVSPYTIGVSSAAAFGASLAIMFGAGVAASLPFTGAHFIPLSAFVFALGCAVLVFSLAWFRGMGAQTMVLTGIALMYLFSALTAAVQFVATQEQLARVVHWTFGSFNGATWDQVAICSVVLLVLLPVVQYGAWSLNALISAGDDVAKSLGVNVAVVRALSVIISVMLAAVVISFAGVIGFIGLVGPHVARLIIGADHRWLVPFSVITGGALLLVADTIGRLAFSPAVIPVGIVIAFVGVPIFLHLILARRNEYFA